MNVKARQAILTAVLLGVPVASFFMVFRPQSQEIKRATREIEMRKEKLGQLQAVTAQAPDGWQPEDDGRLTGSERRPADTIDDVSPLVSVASPMTAPASTAVGSIGSLAARLRAAGIPADLAEAVGASVPAKKQRALSQAIKQTRALLLEDFGMLEQHLLRLGARIYLDVLHAVRPFPGADRRIGCPFPAPTLLPQPGSSGRKRENFRISAYLMDIAVLRISPYGVYAEALRRIPAVRRGSCQMTTVRNRGRARR